MVNVSGEGLGRWNICFLHLRVINNISSCYMNWCGLCIYVGCAEREEM